MGEVDHIRSEPSGRPHVYFKSHKVSDIAKALFCLGQPEELKMYEPAPYLECLESLAAVSLELFRDLRQYVVNCLCSVVYGFGNIDSHE